ncbi:hypothetical protein [Holophaga foetida]|uniref:hypothetical protein n=1 Tax=Holophaga foetida TaxID=35839 RepID=UPI0002474296|nr:hypothetical protein [Holophaga foetida]
MPPPTPNPLPVVSTGRALSWTFEGLPQHVPHPLPTPVALDSEGEADPPPFTRLGLAARWHSKPPSSHPQLLEVRIQLRAWPDPPRSAWLAEIATLLTEWIETEGYLVAHTLPFEDHILGQRVTRHALLGLQSLQGNPLWAHPTAVAAGLLPFDFPPSQACRTLGAPIRWRAGGITPLSPIDPATGLPTWFIALSDCARFQKLPPKAHSDQVLRDRGSELFRQRHFPTPAAALTAAQTQLDEAIQTILGFGHLCPAQPPSHA